MHTCTHAWQVTFHTTRTASFLFPQCPPELLGIHRQSLLLLPLHLRHSQLMIDDSTDTMWLPSQGRKWWWGCCLALWDVSFETQISWLWENSGHKGGQVFGPKASAKVSITQHWSNELRGNSSTPSLQFQAHIMVHTPHGSHTLCRLCKHNKYPMLLNGTYVTPSGRKIFFFLGIFLLVLGIKYRDFSYTLKRNSYH